MRREEWEQDLRERQRNIVFPDTVRNQGNFYRRLLRGNRPLVGAQRGGLVFLAVPVFFGGCLGVALSITGFLHPEDGAPTWLVLILGGLTSAATCIFAGMMLIRALLPTPAARSSNSNKNHRRLGKIRRSGPL